jgi:hypothetical protein
MITSVAGINQAGYKLLISRIGMAAIRVASGTSERHNCSLQSTRAPVNNDVTLIIASTAVQCYGLLRFPFSTVLYGHRIEPKPIGRSK